MKKKILALTLTLLIGGMSAILFHACDKDTNCYVHVTVLDEVTKEPLSGVFVKIDIDSSYVSREGYTDARGVFVPEEPFTAPAIFYVNATYETGYDDSIYTAAEFFCYRKGSNTIRLVEGDTVYCTVNVEETINRDVRR